MSGVQIAPPSLGWLLSVFPSWVSGTDLLLSLIKDSATGGWGAPVDTEQGGVG